MSFKSEFTDRFTKEGRLKLVLLRAQKDDSINSFTKLQGILPQLLQEPAQLSSLWVPFLNIFLEPKYSHMLTSNDFEKIERLAVKLLSDPIPGLDSNAIWRHVINAYIMKGIKKHAQDLLIYIYATRPVSREWKIWAIQTLIEHGVDENDHVSTYMDFLANIAQVAQGQDPEIETISAGIHRILNNICTVDFDSAETKIRHAGATIQLLSANNITVESMHSTRGIYALLIEHNIIKANENFIMANMHNPGDKIALRGLLATWIQRDQYQNVIDKACEIDPQKTASDPILKGMIQLSKLNQWLNSYKIEGPPPADAAEIELLLQLNIQKYVGDRIKTILGRLYLIEGNIQQADKLLSEFASKHPEQSRWRYYTAWTTLLQGKEVIATHYFDQQKQWSGDWSIACLLLDAYPEEIQKNTILTFLKNQMQSNGYHSTIINARLAMANTTSPSNIQWSSGYHLIEEDIEAFRTILGQALFTKNYQATEQLLRDPLFQRLPLPDRLMWSGSLLIQTNKNIQSGCRLLERAAHKFGYKRASLILATYYIQQNNIVKAKQFLEQDIATNHPKTQLLQALMQSREGKISDITLKKCEYGARNNEPWANYILGSYYYQQKHYRQAKITLQEEKMLDTRSPYVALARSAQFSAFPEAPVNIYQALELYTSHNYQTWLIWNAFLELLWHGHPKNYAIINKYYMRIREMLKQLPEKALIAIARAFINLSRKVESLEQCNVMLYLLEDFSRYATYSSVRNLLELGIASTVYAVYTKSSVQQQQKIQTYLEPHLKKNAKNAALAILMTYIYLQYGNKYMSEARLALQNISSGTKKEIQLRNLLLMLVTGNTPIQFTGLADGRYTEEQPWPFRLLEAITLFLDEDQLPGGKAFLQLVESSNVDVQTIANVERIIPGLCICAIREKSLIPQVSTVLTQLSQQNIPHDLAVNLAQYALAMDQKELAGSFIQKRTELEGNVHQQMLINWLCYEAANLYQNNNITKAVSKLKEALQYAEETDQEEQLKRIFNRLQRRLLTDNLLSVQFPSYNPSLVPLGRHHCLEQIIVRHKQLQQALLHKDTKAIKKNWGNVVEQYKMTPRLNHIRALIYREFALNNPDHNNRLDNLITTTAFWVLLLSSEFFWTYFSRERIFDEQGKRVDLDSLQQDILFQDAIDMLLTYHSDAASKAFYEQKYEDAKTHFLCLDMCRKGRQKIVQVLQTKRITFSLQPDLQRLADVSEKAEKLLNQWCAALIHQAEKTLRDPEVLKTLAKNIPLNYEGAIAILEPFIHMEIPMLRVQTCCLDWYNEWCHKLSWQSNFKRVQELVEKAEPIVDQMIFQLTEKQGFRRENQVLSQYFMYKVYTVPYDVNKSIVALKAALLWNPANKQARDILERDQIQLEQEQKTHFSYSDLEDEEQSYEDDYEEQDYEYESDYDEEYY